MPQDLVRPQRLRVLARVEHRVVAGRPSHVGGHVRDDVRQLPFRVQVPEPHGIAAAADRVHGVRQQPPVGTHLARADFAEGVALGHDIDVEQHLLRARAAAGVQPGYLTSLRR